MPGAYTRRFLAANATSASASTVVPASRVWVVRNIVITYRASTSGDQIFVTAINGTTIVAGYRWTTGNPVAYLWESRIALNAGESLGWLTPTGIWDVVITGYDLSV